MLKKLTIEEMQKLAEKREGKCLSTKYINVNTKLKWQCKEGHIWEAMPSNIKKGQWCPYCARLHMGDSQRLSIEEMQEIAKNRGGKCLSTKYINAHTKLKWQCKEGHRWEAAPHGIKSGKWCPYCGGTAKLTIEDMQKIAKSRGGKCLSEKYINSKTKLKWQCKEGYIWEAMPSNIKKGHWCPHCAGEAKLTIEEMQEIAKSRGGKCLSEKYINANTKLKWQCKEGHIWEAAPNNIKMGQWCPICSNGVSERICCKYFEIIFNEKFPKSRHKWLTNSEGNQMELDGFCKELGIAFEYQGQQHYKYNKHFHKKAEEFIRRVGDDYSKQNLCKIHNIVLIEIPYNIEYEKMGEYIVNQCKEKSIKVPKITSEINYRLFNVYSPERLKEMQNLAELKGGKCLSTKYINANTKLKWQCGEGHTWEATPHGIKSGKWCPYCAGLVKLTIEEMQELAEEKDGKCLSAEYINNHTKLRWQCKEGHTWEATPHGIKSGSWCPYCSNNAKLTIEEIQELAKRREGKCLSEKYINSKTKLKWQCKEGHRWEATPNKIKIGRWCPHCARLHMGDSQRLSIEEMQEIAKNRGGKCLSTKYINANTKLKWQCKEGHRWEAIPSSIKKGSWCPVCARKNKGKQKQRKQQTLFDKLSTNKL